MLISNVHICSAHNLYSADLSAAYKKRHECHVVTIWLNRICIHFICICFAVAVESHFRRLKGFVVAYAICTPSPWRRDAFSALGAECMSLKSKHGIIKIMNKVDTGWCRRSCFFLVLFGFGAHGHERLTKRINWWWMGRQKMWQY